MHDRESLVVVVGGTNVGGAVEDIVIAVVGDGEGVTKNKARRLLFLFMTMSMSMSRSMSILMSILSKTRQIVEKNPASTCKW